MPARMSSELVLTQFSFPAIFNSDLGKREGSIDCALPIDLFTYACCRFHNDFIMHKVGEQSFPRTYEEECAKAKLYWFYLHIQRSAVSLVPGSHGDSPVIHGVCHYCAHTVAGMKFHRNKVKKNSM